ncbi:MAG: hypothetical protein ACM3S4_00390 [Burkholderiales bacterium]|jgi:curli biogenesis system outer membrane secretion channel CsgG
MIQKRYLIVFLIICLFIVQACQGCSAKPVLGQKQEISQDDLNTVNNYIAEVGADEISLQKAESINKLEIYENKETHETKTIWQLVVDFVRNEKSDNTVPLGYKIVFEPGGFGLEDNETWERIGG